MPKRALKPKKFKYQVRTPEGIVFESATCKESWERAIRLHDEGTPDVVLLIDGQEAAIFA